MATLIKRINGISGLVNQSLVFVHFPFKRRGNLAWFRRCRDALDAFHCLFNCFETVPTWSGRSQAWQWRVHICVATTTITIVVVLGHFCISRQQLTHQVVPIEHSISKN